MKVFSSLIAAALLVVAPSNSHVEAISQAGATFRYRNYDEMAAYINDLATKYSDVVKVFTAQDRYNLQMPDTLKCNDRGDKCKQFVVHVTNHATLANDPKRPEVFISGALHGDERVGPTTAAELIGLIASATSANAKNLPAGSTPSASTIRWLRELVNTRSVYIMPMTNAYGYAHNTRQELFVDPNRDYNYLKSGRNCMEAMTSRAVNEVWREHMFQLALTFHGGMRAIGYEWGATNHYLDSAQTKSEKSPDDGAQAAITSVMSRFGGAFSDNTYYPYGAMNDLVYGVEGGMEDWAYAASWENDLTKSSTKPFKPCDLPTYGGYPPEKTIYNNVTHRAFNMLVETADEKQPAENTLGAFSDLYGSEVDFSRPKAVGSVGHVTRNARLALMVIDLVQPYLRWVDVSGNAKSVSPDPKAFEPASLFGVSSTQVNSMGCNAGSVAVPTCTSASCQVTGSKVQLGYEVLGALKVDATKIQVSKSSSFAASDIVLETPVRAGITRRYLDLASNTGAKDDTKGTSLFVACINLPSNVANGQFYVRAVATVDQDWKKQGSGANAPAPVVPPQSHYVNARTNPSWNAVFNGRQVYASLNWYSPVITLQVGNAKRVTLTSAAEADPVADTTTHFKSVSFSAENTDAKSSSSFSPFTIGYIVIGAAAAVVAVATVFLYRRAFPRSYEDVGLSSLENTPVDNTFLNQDQLEEDEESKQDDEIVAV